MSYRIITGDCLAEMPKLLADGVQVDSVVTDPPYHLTSIVKRFGKEGSAPAKSNGATGVYGRASRGFMGQTWDGGDVAMNPETWAYVYDLLKPGGHLIALCGTRTEHRVVCAIEDAGFEIRDRLLWLYGSGFPKSHDVSKAIDRKRDDVEAIDTVRAWLEERRQDAGLTRTAVNEALGLADNGGGQMSSWTTNQTTRCVPQWGQWLQLKALLRFGDEMDAEVWRLNGRKGQPGEAWSDREVLGKSDELLGRKSGIGNATDGHYTVGGTIAESYDITAPATEAARQWQGWGTALKPAMEIAVLARKPLSEPSVAANVLKHGTGALNIDACRVATSDGPRAAWAGTNERDDGWGMRGYDPAKTTTQARWPANVLHDGSPEVLEAFAQFGTSGDTPHARGGQGFHNCLGRPDRERRDGEVIAGHADSGTAARFFPALGFSGDELRFRYEPKADAAERAGSKHPTIKPVALVEWLVRLVTPPNGLVLDPFCGSGTTIIACERLGFDAIGIEQDAKTVAEAEERIRRLRARRMLGNVERYEPLLGQLSLLEEL